MRKSWGLTEKILNGEKTVESRWYMNRYRPWNQIEKGETIYFKDSGEPIKIKALVDKVLQFEDLTEDKVRDILEKYGSADGLGVNFKDFENYFAMFKNKKYCVLIFLKDVQSIEPFEIDKSGFGAMSAWLVVDDINKIKK